MNSVVNLFVQGGPILPLLAVMLIGMLVCVVLRSRFWFQLLKKQQKVAHDVLNAARSDMGKAAAIAAQNQNLPLGRFLLAPMKLNQPTPEMFHLALEASADKEFVEMRKGNRLLELVATIAPLFGLLGAALTIIGMFGANGSVTPNIMQSVQQAVIPLAASLIVEIIALILLRVSSTLQAQQAEFFSEVGTMLELYYREFWQAEQRRELIKVLHKNNNSKTNLPQQPQ